MSDNQKASPGGNIPDKADPGKTAANPPPTGLGLREDLLLHDPLLDSVLEVARIHGRPSTRAALSAGLPLQNGRLTPSLVARAANRAGLNCRIVRLELGKIDPIQLPAILLLKGDESCVLLGWEERGGQAQVLFPESGQTAFTLSREDISSRYLGIAIFLQPRVKFDSRTPEVAKLAKRHWFWGAILEQWQVYRDVLKQTIHGQTDASPLKKQLYQTNSLCY